MKTKLTIHIDYSPVVDMEWVIPDVNPGVVNAIAAKAAETYATGISILATEAVKQTGVRVADTEDEGTEKPW